MTARRPQQPTGNRLIRAQQSTFDGTLGGRLRSARPVDRQAPAERLSTSQSAVGGGQIYHSVNVGRVGENDFLIDRNGMPWWPTLSGWTRLFSHWGNAYPLADNPPPWFSGNDPMVMFGLDVATVTDPDTGGMSTNSTMIGSGVRMSSYGSIAMGLVVEAMCNEGVVALGNTIGLGVENLQSFDSKGRPTATPGSRANIVAIGSDLKALRSVNQAILIGVGHRYDALDDSDASDGVFSIGMANSVLGVAKNILQLGTNNQFDSSSGVGPSDLTQIGTSNEITLTDSAIPRDVLMFGTGNTLTTQEDDWRGSGQSFLIGVGNSTDSGNSLAIGLDNNISNAHGVVAIGTNSDVTGAPQSVALGFSVLIEGTSEFSDYSSAQASSANGGNAVGLGTAIALNKYQTIGIGTALDLSGIKSHVLGNGVGITGERSWVIGSDVYPAQDYLPDGWDPVDELPASPLAEDEWGVLVGRRVEIKRSPHTIPDVSPVGDESTGIILHSPDGSSFVITVDNAGTLATTAL